MAFAGDAKRNAKCADGPRAFVFQKERREITFPCLPLGFSVNLARKLDAKPTSLLRFVNAPGAQSGTVDRLEGTTSDELKDTADLRAARERDVSGAHAGAARRETNSDSVHHTIKQGMQTNCSDILASEDARPDHREGKQMPPYLLMVHVLSVSEGGAVSSVPLKRHVMLLVFFF